MTDLCLRSRRVQGFTRQTLPRVCVSVLVHMLPSVPTACKIQRLGRDAEDGGVSSLSDAIFFVHLDFLTTYLYGYHAPPRSVMRKYPAEVFRQLVLFFSLQDLCVAEKNQRGKNHHPGFHHSQHKCLHINYYCSHIAVVSAAIQTVRTEPHTCESK